MDQLYAEIGRMQMQVRAKDAAFTALLSLVGKLVDGSIDPARVLVNLTDQTVNVTAEGEYATLPAQINGLPVCVIAPPVAKMSTPIDNASELQKMRKNTEKTFAAIKRTKALEALEALDDEG